MSAQVFIGELLLRREGQKIIIYEKGEPIITCQGWTAALEWIDDNRPSTPSHARLWPAGSEDQE